MACNGGAALEVRAADWRKVPHEPQNRLPGASLPPHCEQVSVRRLPKSSQDGFAGDRDAGGVWAT